MKEQFQIVQHKLIKYIDTWGTAFNLGYLIKKNKQATIWKAAMGTGNYMHRHSLLGTTRLNELFI